MSYVIPDKINAFNVYQDGVKHIGISEEVTLPDVEEMTSPMAGPGILGEIDSPSHGLFSSTEIEIPFRTLYTNVFNMMRAITSVDLTLRGSTQVQDGLGNLAFVGIRIVCRGRKKGFTPGKFKQGEGTGASVKLELSYFLVEIDGVKELEIDKLNSIYRVHGVDMLAAVRALC